MHTLRDVIDRIRPLPAQPALGSTWPKAFLQKHRLQVPGEGKLVLPGDLQGLAKVDGPGNGVADLSDAYAREARAILISAPALVIPLQPPTVQELQDLSVDLQEFRHAKVRTLGLAVRIKVDEGTSVFGVSRLIAIENGIRFGSTLLLKHEDRWTHDIHEAEDIIIELLRESTVGFLPRAEQDSRPWKKAVALLGGSDTSPRLPHSWKREMKLVAGLREIELDIRPNPESSRALIVADLRNYPPAALLVWADWVANPQIFLAPFRGARPEAHAEILGTPDQTMSFDDHIAELAMHLREIIPFQVEEGTDTYAEATLTWELVAPKIEALVSEHFSLTERARNMLKGNPYPKPARMLDHVSRLEGLARDYFASQGRLGSGFAEYAISNFEIEIALFDSKISASIPIDGGSLSTVPHVKVDDHKDPSNCGRIYFAIDAVNYRLIVDHIGLHNYE